MTPLEMITEWRTGCSCAGPKYDEMMRQPIGTSPPEECLHCTRALIDALERALNASTVDGTRDDVARDDVIRMAREAGFEEAWVEVCNVFDELTALINIAAAAEREACAKVAEAEKLIGTPPTHFSSREILGIMVAFDKTKESIAAAIRARGEKGGA